MNLRIAFALRARPHELLQSIQNARALELKIEYCFLLTSKGGKVKIQFYMSSSNSGRSRTESISACRPS